VFGTSEKKNVRENKKKCVFGTIEKKMYVKINRN
jgi:hypothetical protein